METEFNKKRLVQFLLESPSRFDFTCNEETRKHIRRGLFFSASHGGKYLSHFFPNYDSTEILDWDKVYDKMDSNDHKNWILNYNDSENLSHPHMTCSKLFRKGQPIYRCLTCGFDDTCALCSHCFKEEDHKDHKVHILICQKEKGGVCDCGDPEAWVKEFKCPHYEKETLTEETFPDDFKTSLFNTIDVALDYILDVMSKTTSTLPKFTTVEEIINHSNDSDLDEAVYGGKDVNSEKYYLMAYNDSVRQFRDVVQRIHLATNKVPEFGVMITEEIEEYGKAKVIGSDNVSLLLQREKVLSSTGLTTSIRSYRDVFREDACDEIIRWLRKLTEGPLFKDYLFTKDLLCQSFCRRWTPGVNSPHLIDMYQTGKLHPGNKIPKIPHSNPVGSTYWKFTPSMWELPKDLCEDCDYNLNLDDYVEEDHLGSRLQYFIYFDIRFWKSIREILHELYITNLITNLKYKNMICFQYIDIYPTIADMFLSSDREPEYNIMCTLSAQLFTCPSNSTAIVQHGDLSKIFAAIYGFLTVNRIVAPESVNLSKEVLYHSLKNRRWSQIFFDISYILSRSDDSKTILSYPVLFPAIDIIALFQGKPVITREAIEHVEYESNDYGVYFSSISVICRFAEDISKRIVKLSEKDTKLAHYAAAEVLRLLEKIETDSYPGIISSSIDVITAKEYEVVPTTGLKFPQFHVDSDKVSFLHPLHSFLSWLIQLTNFKSLENFRSFFSDFMTPDRIIPIFDYPIRTIVLLSQIKVGLWVRNGFSVRQQLHIYRTTGIRECGYMRDLFLTQVLSNLLSSDDFCHLILSRWRLLGWVNGDTSHDVYENASLQYMVEECLNFLLNLVTEDTFLCNKSNEEITETGIRKEIIHTLCFKPLTYSKLWAEVPEHIASEKKFEIILKEIANYYPPKSTTDSGTYKLKETYFDQIDPYYIHFTSNRRDDAIKIIKERQHKQTGESFNDIYIEPKTPTYGIYTATPLFTTSVFFGDLLLYTLDYILNEGASKADSLLDLTLHLVHTISNINPSMPDEQVSFYSVFINNHPDNSIGHHSCALVLYKMLASESFKAFHSKIRAIFHTVGSKNERFHDYLQSSVPDFNGRLLEYEIIQNVTESDFERKRRLAKERQNKLMAKFKKQQSKFVENNTSHDFDKSDVEMDDAEDLSAWKFPDEHCILCQNSGNSDEPFGIISYVSKSSEFRNIPFEEDYWFLKSFSDSASLDSSELDAGNTKYPERLQKFVDGVKADNIFGPGFPCNEIDTVHSELVSSSCGHGMHYSCYSNYVHSIRNRQAQITRTVPENAEHKEFLCPLCKAINNMFIPVLWHSNKRSLSKFVSPTSDSPYSVFESLAFKDIYDQKWLDMFQMVAHQDLRRSAESTMSKTNSKIIFGSSNNAKDRIKASIGTLMKNLVTVTFPYVFRGDSNVLLVHTIKSAEISLRGVPSDGKLVIHQLSNNCLTNLRTWAEFKSSWLIWKSHAEMNSKNRGSTFEECLANLVCLSSDTLYPSMTESDFFQTLISIIPVESLGFSFNSILQLCFMGHLIQTFYKLTVNLSAHNFYDGTVCGMLDLPIIEGIDKQTADNAAIIFKKIKDSLNIHELPENKEILDHPMFGRVFSSMVIKCCNPFLRRAAIWAHVICADMSDIDFETECFALEADRLSHFLNIPTTMEMMSNILTDGTYESSKFNGFLNYLNNLNEPFFRTPQVEYPGIIRLIDLPHRLDNFFTKYYYPEVENNVVIEDPAICLFCGEVVDIQKQAAGSLNGECTVHYQKECNNEYGIFLAPKHSSLLLLYRKNGSFFSAPYLDIHGELDEDGKHGQPLYLSKLRYDDFIRNLWLQHNIPNYITRKLEGVLDIGGWETL